MDRWLIFGMVICGGFGTLTFLRIVCHEIVIKNREIEFESDRVRDEIKKRLEAEHIERLEQQMLAKSGAKKSA